MCWNWGGLLNQYHSLSSHFLIAAQVKSCTAEGTWEPLWPWITWSLEALLKGYHPEVGPDNQPLRKGTCFEQLKGQPLTPGHYRAVVWSIQGDHEMYSNTLQLPHWQSAAPCWSCDCQQPLVKGKPCPKGKSFKILKEEQQKFQYIDTKKALLKGNLTHPLFSVGGITTRLVRHDGLHVMFVRGVASHLVGSILHYLCFLEGKGKQSVKPSDRLALIFEQVQESYRQLKTPTRLTNLKMSMLCDPAKPHAKWAKLDCKGAEMKHFCVAFLPVAKAILAPDKEEHQDMIAALTSMVALIDLFDKAHMFPTKKQYNEARNLEKRFFHHYDNLNVWAKKVSRLLFHIVIKFHTFHHMVRDSCHLNPRFTWNFRAEDYVGKIAKLGASVAFGVKSTRLCQKLCLKYRVLLHLQLERLGFGHMAFHDDP